MAPFSGIYPSPGMCDHTPRGHSDRRRGRNPSCPLIYRDVLADVYVAHAGSRPRAMRQASTLRCALRCPTRYLGAPLMDSKALLAYRLPLRDRHLHLAVVWP